MSTDKINTDTNGLYFDKVCKKSLIYCKYNKIITNNYFFLQLLLLFCLKEEFMTKDLTVVQWFDFKHKSEDFI